MAQTIIKPSQLVSLNYCELQLFLKEKLKLSIDHVNEVAAGTEKHKEIEKKTLELPPVEDFTEKEFSKPYREVVIPEFSIFYKGIAGKIDEIRLDKNLIEHCKSSIKRLLNLKIAFNG